MSNNPRSKTKRFSVFESLGPFIAGLQSQYPPTYSFQIDGHANTQSDLVVSLEGDRALQSRVDAARTTLKSALADREAGLAAAKLRFESAVAAVKADKGPHSSALLAFGITPVRARTPLSSTQRVLAAAKREATRKARGTMGKRQREAITSGGQPGLALLTPQGNAVTLQPNVPPVEPNAAPHAAPTGTAPASTNSGSSPAATPTNGSGSSSGTTGH